VPSEPAKLVSEVRAGRQRRYLDIVVSMKRFGWLYTDMCEKWRCCGSSKLKQTGQPLQGRDRAGDRAVAGNVCKACLVKSISEDERERRGTSSLLLRLDKAVKSGW
jgi:hypothetical protein